MLGLCPGTHCGWPSSVLKQVNHSVLLPMILSSKVNLKRLLYIAPEMVCVGRAGASLFDFIGYGFYFIVHLRQLINYLVCVIIFYHRDMKVDSGGIICRMLIKQAIGKRF